MITDYKRAKGAHEEELKRLEEEMNRQAAALDEEVEAAVKKPEQMV